MIQDAQRTENIQHQENVSENVKNILIKEDRKMTNEPMKTELLNLECWVPQVSGWLLSLPQSGLILLEPAGICVYHADSFLVEVAENLSKNSDEF